MINIDKIKEDTNANLVIIADDKGNIIETTEAEYAVNFALMTEAAFAMSKDLLKNLTDSDLEQLIAKSSNGLFIANKIKSNFLILIATTDLTKFGLLLKYMNSIQNN